MRDARQEAKDFLEDNFIDEIVEQLIEKGEASDDINNDYPNGDGLFHEQVTDYDYDLGEAAEILDEYYRHEETDSGLWEGLEPRRAIGAQAAYTFSNAVYYKLSGLFEEINEIDVDEARESLIQPMRNAHEREQTQLADEDPDHEVEAFDEEQALLDIEEELKEEIARQVRAAIYHY